MDEVPVVVWVDDSVVVVVSEAVVLAAPTGGTEIGWPAAEHWETTATETAVKSISSYLDGCLWA